MINRIWHGRTKKEFANEYRQYVIDTGMKDYTGTSGNLGAQIWQREEGETTDFWTISWWDNYESIKRFAGEDFEKARYYEEDRKYLLDFEPKVLHCETYDFSQGRNGSKH